MVNFNKINALAEKSYVKAGLIPTVKNELKKMEETGTNVASEGLKNLLISWGVADNNKHISKEDLNKILKVLSA